MKTISLNNGIQMPMLGFGTFQISGSACEAAVSTALGVGYRLIDTAEAYGNEAEVGRALASCSLPREDLFITTKVNFTSYEHTRASVFASLEKLQVSYLDLVLLHWPFGNVYTAWRVLEALYEEKLIRAIGVSNFEPDRLVDLISYNHIVPAVNQIETHLYCQRHQAHLWEDKYHVAHEAYAPLGQNRASQMFSERDVQLLCKKYNKTAAQILLRFNLQNDVIVIPKSVHEERMRENLDVFNFELTASEMLALRQLDKNAPMIGTPEDPAKVEAALRW